MFQRYGFTPSPKYEKRPHRSELEADVAVTSDERKARGLEASRRVVDVVAPLARRARAVRRGLGRMHRRLLGRRPAVGRVRASARRWWRRDLGRRRRVGRVGPRRWRAEESRGDGQPPDARARAVHRGVIGYGPPGRQRRQGFNVPVLLRGVRRLVLFAPPALSLTLASLASWRSLFPVRDGRGLRSELLVRADLGLALAVDEDRVRALGDPVGADFADVRHGIAGARVGDGRRRRVFAAGYALEEPVRIARAGGGAVASGADTAAARPRRAGGTLGATGDGRRRGGTGADTALKVARAVARAGRVVAVRPHRPRGYRGAAATAGAARGPLRAGPGWRRAQELEHTLVIGEHVLTTDARSVRAHARQVRQLQERAIGIYDPSAARAAARRPAAAGSGRSTAARTRRAAAARARRSAAARTRGAAAARARAAIAGRSVRAEEIGAPHTAEGQTREGHREKTARQTTTKREPHGRYLSSLRAGARPQRGA